MCVPIQFRAKVALRDSDIKPGACKLWPFKVCKEPKYGRPEEALFNSTYGDLYVYIDSRCSGIIYGVPSREFISKVIPEFVELGLGGSNSQLYSTRRSTSTAMSPFAPPDHNLITAINGV